MRLPKHLVRRVKVAAIEQETTGTAFVAAAVREALARTRAGA